MCIYALSSTKKIVCIGMLSMALMLASCRKEMQNVVAPESYPGLSFADIFQGFWTGMNHNYVFWSIDTTNWDNMYHVYKPQFDSLDVTLRKTGLTQTLYNQAGQYFVNMTSGLMDSHYTLSLPYNFSFNYGNLQGVSLGAVFQPAYLRKYVAGMHSRLTNQLFDTIIPNNYLQNKDALATQIYQVYGRGVYTTTSTDSLVIHTGLIPTTSGSGYALYLQFNQFTLSNGFNSSQTVYNALSFFLQNLTSPAANGILVFNNAGNPVVVSNSKPVRGIIIDLRNNGGGSTSDLDFLVGSLVTNSYKIGATRYKNGNGRLDYTPWADAYVRGQSIFNILSTSLRVPVVVLVDAYSVSMAELTTMAIKSLPNGNGVVVGETTWGGNGPLISGLTQNSVVFNGGQFNVGFLGQGSINVYTSSCMFRYIDGNIYEGKGFPPDVAAPYDASVYTTNKDTQLEVALSQIK